jgi:glucuronoarabinoxylan endo-1,4-beta-xylanase
MGNFSRFVRPGSFRVGTASKPSDGVFATAFKSADASQVVIVAVNASTSPVAQHFELSGATFAEVTPWITSDTFALEAQPVLSGGAAFSYELPARSVTSFVGAVN